MFLLCKLFVDISKKSKIAIGFTQIVTIQIRTCLFLTVAAVHIEHGVLWASVGLYLNDVSLDSIGTRSDGSLVEEEAVWR